MSRATVSRTQSHSPTAPAADEPVAVNIGIPILTSGPEDQAPPRPFTERFLSVLQVLADGRGQQTVRTRSIRGFSAGDMTLQPDPREIHPRLLDLLAEEDVQLRLQITTHGGDRTPLDLPALTALWRLPMHFTEATGWKYRVPKAELDKVLKSLADFPLAPNVLLDATPGCYEPEPDGSPVQPSGHCELVSVWRFSEPLQVDQDEAPAVQLLEALARRLGSDLAFAQDLQSTVAIGGAIRNVGNTPPLARVEIVEVDPEARYTVEEIRAALAEPITTAKKEARK